MPTQVQFRRGTQSQNAAFTGAAGELSINSDSNSARVHDGSTLGGFELARADMSNVGVGTTLTLSVVNAETVNVSGTLTSTNFVVSGVSTLNNLSVLGVSTFAGITTVTGETLFSKQLEVSGISTFAGITTVTGETLFSKQLNVSGVSTLASVVSTTVNATDTTTQNILVVGITTLQSNLSVSGISTISGVTINSGVVTSSSGIVTYYGDLSNSISGRWTITATNSPNSFTLTGIGLTEPTDDPIIYLLRGQTYQFVNNSGTGEGFFIRNSFSGANYDNGVIGNGSTNSIITFSVPFNAPNTLFYQSNVNTAMGSTIVIVPNAFTW